MKNYPYRFKTREEMTRDFGEGWNRHFDNNYTAFWVDNMNYLLGREIEHDFDVIKNTIRLRVDGYTILKEWITKNKQDVPNYKPRKLREI